MLRPDPSGRDCGSLFRLRFGTCFRDRLLNRLLQVDLVLVPELPLGIRGLGERLDQIAVLRQHLDRHVPEDRVFAAKGAAGHLLLDVAPGRLPRDEHVSVGTMDAGGDTTPELDAVRALVDHQRDGHLNLAGGLPDGPGDLVDQIAARAGTEHLAPVLSLPGVVLVHGDLHGHAVAGDLTDGVVGHDSLPVLGDLARVAAGVPDLAHSASRPVGRNATVAVGPAGSPVCGLCVYVITFRRHVPKLVTVTLRPLATVRPITSNVALSTTLTVARSTPDSATTASTRDM